MGTILLEWTPTHHNKTVTQLNKSDSKKRGEKLRRDGNLSSWRLTYPGADLLSRPMVITCNGDYESIDDFDPDDTDVDTLDTNDVESIDDKTTLEHFNWPKYKRGFEWPYTTTTSFERTKCRFPYYLPKKEEFGDFGGKWHERCIWMSYLESLYQPVCRHDNHEGWVPLETFSTIFGTL